MNFINNLKIGTFSYLKLKTTVKKIQAYFHLHSNVAVCFSIYKKTIVLIMSFIYNLEIGTCSYLKLKIIPRKMQASFHLHSNVAVCCFNRKKIINYELY
ncbi:MAG: hypothetical protein ACRC63_03125 [Metamycoplasmataceae bacterium]